MFCKENEIQVEGRIESKRAEPKMELKLKPNAHEIWK